MLRDHGLQFPQNIVLLSLEFIFFLANSADTDGMPYLGLLCLPNSDLKRLNYQTLLTFMR